MPQQLITNGHLYGVPSTSQFDAFVPVAEQQTLHAAAAAAFFAMRKAAEADGIEVACASGFRSFDKQKSIWERKFNQDPRYCNLPLASRIEAILQWSALPGTSRHHWGTDLDIYDANQIERAALKLEAWEYESNGPCNMLYQWLQTHAASFDFYQPYDEDRGGVGFEPWHWSYMPLAKGYLNDFSSDTLLTLLREQQLSGLEFVSEHIEALVQRYVFNINPRLLSEV